MPRRFLSKIERERLSQFPAEVTEADRLLLLDTGRQGIHCQ
jgi:hypothetical protein